MLPNSNDDYDDEWRYKRRRNETNFLQRTEGIPGQPVHHLANFAPEVLRMMPLLIDGCYEEDTDLFDNRKIESRKFRELLWNDLVISWSCFCSKINKILEQLRLRSNSINLRHGVLKVCERTIPITFWENFEWQGMGHSCWDQGSAQEIEAKKLGELIGDISSESL